MQARVIVLVRRFLGRKILLKQVLNTPLSSGLTREYTTTLIAELEHRKIPTIGAIMSSISWDVLLVARTNNITCGITHRTVVNPTIIAIIVVIRLCRCWDSTVTSGRFMLRV